MVTAAHAANITEGTRLLAETHIDLLVLNFDPAKADNLLKIQKIQADYPKVRLILIPSNSSGEPIFRGSPDRISMQFLVRGRKVNLSLAMDSSEALPVPPASDDDSIAVSDVSAELIARTHPPCTLSERERQVLALMVEGLTNQEIGKKLSISLGTAKAHVRSILHKLGVDDRTKAAVQALRIGLV